MSKKAKALPDATIETTMMDVAREIWYSELSPMERLDLMEKTREGNEGNEGKWLLACLHQIIKERELILDKRVTYVLSRDIPIDAIRNLDAMPRGLGCMYLECLRHTDGTLIAAQWRRKLPQNYECIVVCL